jgi:hypothetical protein
METVSIPATFILNSHSSFSDIPYPDIAYLDEIIIFFKNTDKHYNWTISYNLKDELNFEIQLASKKEVVSAHYKVIGEFNRKKVMKKLQEIKLSISEERKQKLIEIFEND